MTLPVGMTQAILLLHGRRCRYCGRTADTADHIIPRHQGGKDNASNLTAACRRCNSSKGAFRLPADVEKQLLTEAWINAPEAARLSEVFAKAQDDARKRPAILAARQFLWAA
jgi:5-methylcytosine-specific restriction endonuclease McrA